HRGTFGSKAQSAARFGQIVNPVDPTAALKVERPAVVKALREAMFAPAEEPVLVIGEDGVGKTWAVAEALDVAQGDDLVLLVPSRAVEPDSTLERLIVRALDGRFADGTEAGWKAGLEEWAPSDGTGGSGRRILLVLDGVNQSRFIDLRWLFADALSPRWRGVIKLVVVLRPRNQPEAVVVLARHNITPVPVTVEGYSDRELRDALAGVGRPNLSYAEASASLQALLRTPRYFRAAAALWERVAGLEHVTPARLMIEDLRQRYEYGEAELNADGWAQLLAHLGGRLLREPRSTFLAGELRSALATTSLDPDSIEAGLRDIRSGRLFEVRGADRYALNEERAPLAIGLAVAMRLLEEGRPDVLANVALIDELLPDQGADARADALRAAVAVALCWDLLGAS
ncbi:MAG: hypothetical protein Q8S13_08320, partial [Dehalococcoidia bacterium]|nr:hypothetical protein [Dehalococcoidia bacterium]